MNIVVGIPRALLYYKYYPLWKRFFDNLSIKTILSGLTTKETLEKGSRYVVDEACLSLKIFMGHVESLEGKCDYILVPRLVCVKKKEKLCTNFSCLYDLTRNLFITPILSYNVDVEQKQSEFEAFLTLGKTLGFSYQESAHAYFDAKRFSEAKKLDDVDRQNVLLKQNNLKMLLVGHPYNLYDKYIAGEIVDYLKKEKINVLYSDRYDTKNIESDAAPISKEMYWTYNKEIIASLNHYKKEVDGVIVITSFPCGPDSLANEMIIHKVKDVPLLFLIRDELSSSVGLMTRLESFIDIIKERKNRHEKTRNR